MEEFVKFYYIYVLDCFGSGLIDNFIYGDVDLIKYGVVFICFFMDVLKLDSVYIVGYFMGGLFSVNFVGIYF